MSRRGKRRKRKKKKRRRGKEEEREEEEVAWKKKKRGKKEGSLTGNSWPFTRLATVSWIQVWTVVTNRFIKTGQSFSTPPSFFCLHLLADETGPVAHFPFVSHQLLPLATYYTPREPATLHAGSRIGKIYFSLCARIYLALTSGRVSL